MSSAYYKQRGTQDEEGGLKAPLTRESNGSIFRRHCKATTFMIALAIIIAIATPLGISYVQEQKRQRAQAADAANSASADVWQLQPGLQPGSVSRPNLLLTFNNTARDAMELIPPVLMPFVRRLNLSSSLFQVLKFDTEEVMQAALRYIEYYPEVNFLARDFEVFLPDEAFKGLSINDFQASNSSTDARETNTIGKRKLQQSASGTAQAGSATNDPLLHYQWYLDQINAPAAWQAYSTGAEIIVAVVDTGIDLGHPDLVDALWTNSKEIPDNGIDDDGNGYVDDIHGYNFNGACAKYDSSGACQQCMGNGSPVDTIGHGSHVAGLIAAIRDNKEGISGVAPRIKIMALKVLDCKGAIYTTAVFQAFDYALQMGAHIVSCSFGGKFDKGFVASSPAPAIHATWTESYKKAIQPLMDKGILLVAAAGNDNINMDLLQQYGYAYNPCLAPLGNVLCVMSTTQKDVRSSFSNYGFNSTDMASPGNDILSTYKNGGYRFLNGTSMATPLVSGSAAMMLSTIVAQGGSPYGKVQMLKDLLESTGQQIQNLPTRSGRRLNLLAALTAASQAAGASAVAVNPLELDVGSTSLMVQGVREVYYDLQAIVSNSSSASLPTDSSIRESVLPMASFKHTDGVLLQLAGHVFLDKAGTYVIQVTGSTGQVSMMVNGQELQVKAGSSKASLTAKAPGWFLLTVKLPNPLYAINLQLQPPGAASPSAMPTLWQVGYAKYAPLSGTVQTLAATANQGFLTYYTALSAADKKSAAEQAIIQSSASATLPNPADFALTTILPALNLTAGKLRQALFPPSLGTLQAGAGVQGMATARLNVKDYTCFVFKLKCERCTLWVDKMLVIDNWEPSSIAGGLAKASAPVNFTSAGYHTLAVTFAVTQLETASLMLQWARCDASKDSSAYVDSTNIDSTLFWQPEKAVTGWIGGMQCDVWNSPLANRSAAPMYKVRLPDCPGPQHNASDKCQLRSSFQLDQVLPGLAQAHAAVSAAITGMFSVRCWSYTAVAFQGSILAGPAETSARVWLTGGEVYRSSAAAKELGSSINSDGANTVQQPLLTLSKYYRLLVAEWTNISATTTLTLADSNGPFTLDQDAWRLPVAPSLPSSQRVTIRGTGVGAYLADYPISTFPIYLAKQAAAAATVALSSTADNSTGTNETTAGAVAGAADGTDAGMEPPFSQQDIETAASGNGTSADIISPGSLNGTATTSARNTTSNATSIAASSSPPLPSTTVHADSDQEQVQIAGTEAVLQPEEDYAEDTDISGNSGSALMKQMWLAPATGHVSLAYNTKAGPAFAKALLPYTVPDASQISIYASDSQGITDITATYPGPPNTREWYSRCLGLWRVDLLQAGYITLRIKHPAAQSTQVTIGDITVHSPAQEAADSSGMVVVSRQLMMVGGTYLVDVLARAPAGQAQVTYSVSILLPQQVAIGSKTWLSLVGR